MKTKFTRKALALLAVSLLAGCEGGGGGGDAGSGAPSASTLSGVAAVGYPIANGTLNVNCATGNALTTTTSNTGAWQVTVSGQAPPCAVQVTGGTINSAANATSYHSIATAFGTVNVTPLTDLIVANLTGAANPSVWFAGSNSTALTAITQSQVDAALANLRAALGLASLSTINPITTAFTPASGNISDDTLVALRTAMTSAGVSYAGLLSNASASTFVAPAGFGAALTTAYAGTLSGGGGASSGGGSGSGGLMGGAIQGAPLNLTTVVTTLAGYVSAIPVSITDATGTAASFYSPYGITTDGTNLYVVDLTAIRKIVIATGAVTTLASTGYGTVGWGSAGVDGTGTAARFARPQGITTDGTSLYVSDIVSTTIRKLQ